MDNERFYWIKLRTDFFNLDEIDFLLSQPNGAEYVVLYEMLCLKVANTSGKLMREIGEIIAPYTTEQIVRDCKYFDFDTVVVALELYKKLGLIYVDEDGVLSLTKVHTMIGSESASKDAIKKREYRAKMRFLEQKGDTEKDIIEDIDEDNSGDKRGTKCPTDIRDKSIDIKKEKDIPKGISKKKEKNSFFPPTLDEVKSYCEERGNSVDPQKFVDFYEAKGWMIGKNKMKDWKASVRTWEREDKSRYPSRPEREDIMLNYSTINNPTMSDEEVLYWLNYIKGDDEDEKQT